jgi:hypothetical protein
MPLTKSGYTGTTRPSCPESPFVPPMLMPLKAPSISPLISPAMAAAMLCPDTLTTTDPTLTVAALVSSALTPTGGRNARRSGLRGKRWAPATPRRAFLSV